MDLPDCPPGAEGYEDTVTEVPKKPDPEPEEPACTKAEQEFKEHLNSLKIKLEDGTTRCMVERRGRDISGKWIYLCYPCAAVCSGESILQTHISGKKHKTKLTMRNVWPLSIFKEHPFNQNANKPAQGTATEKVLQKMAEEVDLHNKNPSELDLKYNKYRNPTCHIQDSLDAVKAPLLGVEYLIEHPPELPHYEPSYICTLCSKQGHPRTIINHMTCFWHRYNYLLRHYPSACALLTPYRAQPKYREGVGVIMHRLAQRIEDKYGRKRPVNIEKEEYEKDKERIHQWIFRGHHYNEKDGSTFEEVVDIGLIDSLHKSMEESKARSAAKDKRGEPSPPKVAAPSKPLFNNFSEVGQGDSEASAAPTGMPVKRKRVRKRPPVRRRKQKEARAALLATTTAAVPPTRTPTLPPTTTAAAPPPATEAKITTSKLSHVSAPETPTTQIPDNQPSVSDTKFKEAGQVASAASAPPSGTPAKSKKSIQKARWKMNRQTRRELDGTGKLHVAKIHLLIGPPAPKPPKIPEPPHISSTEPPTTNTSHNKPTTDSEPTLKRKAGRQERRAGSAGSLSDISDEAEHERRVDASRADRHSSRIRGDPHHKSRYEPYPTERRRETSPYRGRFAIRNQAASSTSAPSARKSQEKQRPPNYEYKVKLAEEKRLAAEESAKKTLAYHEKNPEKHPLYPEEWKKFWNKRYKEIQSEGKDPSKHDFKPEWIVFWTARMKELHEEELRVQVNEIYRRMCLSPPDMNKGSSSAKPSPPRAAEQRRRSPEPRRRSPERRRPERPERAERADRYDRCDRTEYRGREPLPPRRRSLERRRSPASRHRSVERHREPPRFKDTRSRSPVHRRSPARTHISLDAPPPRRSRSPLSQRGAQPRNRSPEPPRQLAPSLQTVLISDDEFKADDGLSPWNSDNDIDSVGSAHGFRTDRSRTGSVVSRPAHSVAPDGAADDVVATLRLLVALEDYLGSLGPKVVDLLADALKMEKDRANSSEELLERESAVVLLETAKEKLKGAAQAGLVGGPAAAAVRAAVVRVAATLHEADKRARKHKQTTIAPSKPAAVPVAGVGEVDRAQIAQQMAEALIAQGKTDVSSEELAQLVDAVVGMAEAKKREAEKLKKVPEKPSPVVVRKPAVPVKMSGTASALQMLQSAYDENDKKMDRDDVPDAMDGLSDSDLETLLKNFNELSAEEQHSLIAYLKKMEAKEPARVERLRQYVSEAASTATKIEEDVDKVEELAAVIVESDDDDDYTVEEVFQSATQKVKEDQIRQEMEIVKKSLEEAQPTDKPVIEPTTLDRANSSEELLERESAVVLLETAKEKLKGAAQAGLVGGPAASAVRAAVVRVAATLHEADKRARKHKQTTIAPSKPAAVPVAGVGEVDRAQIAQQMAEALIAQGKTDVSSEELAQLVDAVVGMAEAKKREAEKLKKVPEKPSPVVVRKPAAPVKMSGTASALQMLQSAYDENDKKMDRDDVPDAMDGLSDSDLETLLKNFNELSAEEQHSLIAYLKKMEAKEPARVERLRQYVSEAASTATKIEEDVDKVDELAAVIVESDDDDDYTVEEVFQSATQKVKEDQIRQEMEIVKKSLEEAQPTDKPVIEPTTLVSSLTDITKSLSSATDLFALVQASMKSTSTSVPAPASRSPNVVASNTQPRSFGDLPEAPMAVEPTKPLLPNPSSNPAPSTPFQSQQQDSSPAPFNNKQGGLLRTPMRHPTPPQQQQYQQPPDQQQQEQYQPPQNQQQNQPSHNQQHNQQYQPPQHQQQNQQYQQPQHQQQYQQQNQQQYQPQNQQYQPPQQQQNQQRNFNDNRNKPNDNFNQGPWNQRPNTMDNRGPLLRGPPPDHFGSNAPYNQGPRNNFVNGRVQDNYDNRQQNQQYGNNNYGNNNYDNNQQQPQHNNNNNFRGRGGRGNYGGPMRGRGRGYY